MSALAHTIAIVVWLPCVSVAWRAGCFWPIYPRSFREHARMARQVSLATVGVRLTGALIATAIALWLGAQA